MSPVSLAKVATASCPAATFKTAFANEIADLLRARFPIVQVFTYEEERALKVVVDVAKALTYHIHVWTVVRGLVSKLEDGDEKPQTFKD